ncbi:MAG: hypothetical protein GY773_02650, partial [Actinomycetia bacterium]|nr:hypothetical protein [Actinomycetes bacterium]
DADDEMMEQYMLFNLNEAELTGSSDRVHVVAQVDRFEGGFVGDGNWSSARRFHVTRDDDLAVIGSEEVGDLGEVNMADESTLADFVTWAVETYPADKHVLVMHDHGAGWPGGWTDGSAAGDLLTLAEIEGALAQVREDTGLDQLELIGFDACLMSSLEVYTAMAPYARYAVASEGLEPHPGWAYGSFLADLASNPDMSGADLAQSVVAHYID